MQVLLRIPTGDHSADLTLFDVAGRRVCTLVSGEVTSGEWKLSWDGADEHGGRIAGGTYFLRLTSANGDQVTERVTIVR
jgi:flagellar hook assembly protein FlgD